MSRLPPGGLLSLSLSLTLTLGCVGPAPAPGRPVDEAAVAQDLNERFLQEDLDVQEFVGTFEVESREIFTRRAAIVEFIGLQPGDRVADVGAGTGLFMARLSRAVGPQGTVFAVEISPSFVAHLRRRARSEGLTNVEVVHAAEKDVLLPRASVDVAFLCDTYHHFTYPRTTLASLMRAIRPGGSLVVVDFERIPGVSQEWILGHVRAAKEQVIAEIHAAGFEYLGEEDAGLEENYLIRFRR